MPGDDRVDAYLARLPAEHRALLDGVRARIAELVPDAQETISYGIPAFSIRGRPFVWYAGWKAHCSVYPISDAILASHEDELKAYARTKGSLHFAPERPLPRGVLDELVRERLAEVEAGRS